MKPYILISSCLIGLSARYDGATSKVEELINLIKEGKAIFMCPEQAGGLATPRSPSEIELGKTAKDVLVGKGRVVGKDGINVTEEFLKGANETLHLCKTLGIRVAILKEKSPSCGSNQIYDGTFSGNKIVGNGITAELLMQNGIKVYSEHDFPNDL